MLTVYPIQKFNEFDEGVYFEPRAHRIWMGAIDMHNFGAEMHSVLVFIDPVTGARIADEYEIIERPSGFSPEVADDEAAVEPDKSADDEEDDPVRKCEYCERPLKKSAHPRALYCDNNGQCKKLAQSARQSGGAK